MPNDRVVLYMHVPKCGGTTLSAMLRSNFPRDRVAQLDCLETDLEHGLQRLDLDPDGLDFVWGHFPYGLHAHLARPSRYITVLRHPVDRTVSLYSYVAREPQHPLHTWVRGNGISLQEFVTSDRDRTQVRNGQVRQLAGRMDVDPDEDALALACRRLEQFAVVGLTERFDETFVLLRRRLGLRLPFYLRRNVAVSDRRPDPDPSAVAAIRERNDLDLQLYDRAQELFAAQLDREGTALQKAVDSLRRVNRVLDRVDWLAEPALRVLRRFLGGSRGG